MQSYQSGLIQTQTHDGPPAAWQLYRRAELQDKAKKTFYECTKQRAVLQPHTDGQPNQLLAGSERLPSSPAEPSWDFQDPDSHRCRQSCGIRRYLRCGCIRNMNNTLTSRLTFYLRSSKFWSISCARQLQSLFCRAVLRGGNNTTLVSKAPANLIIEMWQTALKQTWLDQWAQQKSAWPRPPEAPL